MDRRPNLTASSALLGVCLLMPATASAQSASDAEKIQKLERQTELLQKQSELLQKELREIKEELARTRRRFAAVRACQVSIRRAPRVTGFGAQLGWNSPSDFRVSIASARVRP
jgi:septal ring factor EnvC (AmiA/AmiB activator)